MWTLRRYLLRPDFFKKVAFRFKRYRRRAERNSFEDVAFALEGVRTPTVVFDVGANIGLVTSTLLRLFPSARVHAFEPTPQTAEVLRERLAHDARGVINELAVSDRDGSTVFRVDNKTHGGGSNSLLHHSEHFATRARVDRYREVQVVTTTLDSYAEQHSVSHIDLLKLDIEGAELLALQGAKNLLATQAVDFVSTEIRFVADYEGQPLLVDLIEHLAPLGYTLFNIYAPAESTVRQALWGDALFMSDALRRQMHAVHGPSACGWSEKPHGAGDRGAHQSN